MPIKLKLTPQAILDKKFLGSTPGYNPLEVDEFIDKILKDYRLLEGCVVLKNKELDELNAQITSLTEENKKLSIENLKYKGRLSNVKENDVVTSENLDLIKRINALEKFLFDHGFDPTKIK